MSSIDGIDCGCWKLTQPLTDPEEALPDHLCGQTARASVREWVCEALDDFVPTAQHLAFYTARLRPESVPTRIRDEISESGGISLIVPLTELEPFLETAKGLWPLRVGDRDVALVLRQWAQERPSAALAKLLKRDGGWNTEVAAYRAVYDVWAEENPGADPAGWVEGREWWRQNPGGGLAADIERDIERSLRRRGLPSTPATVRHLLACAAGWTGPLPARGLLVTTFAFVKHAYRDGSFSLDPNPTSSIAGGLAWTSGPLFTHVRGVALKHRDWIRCFADHPLAGADALRSAALPVPERRTINFLEEAVGTAYVVKGLVHSGRNRAKVMDDHLDAVYKRVAERRRGADLDTTPPPGWREEAARLILAQLQ
jgi:hypothetical protein